MAVRWKSLRLLMKCPSASYVEQLFEEVFSARHESIPSAVSLEHHATAMRVDQLRLEQMFDAMRQLITKVFSSLSFPFSDEMTSKIVVDLVPSMDARLVELIAKIITDKSSSWRTRMIQQAPAAPRLLNSRCAVCLDHKGNQSTVVVLEMEVQPNPINCEVFAATEDIQVRLREESLKEMVTQLQRIKEQLALAAGSTPADQQSIPSMATKTGKVAATETSSCMVP